MGMKAQNVQNRVSRVAQCFFRVPRKPMTPVMPNRGR